ncbi:MAG: hypothetical protein WEE53_12160, partial [Acidimicrobiia bacterium]
ETGRVGVEHPESRGVKAMTGPSFDGAKRNGERSLSERRARPLGPVSPTCGLRMAEEAAAQP